MCFFQPIVSGTTLIDHDQLTRYLQFGCRSRPSFVNVAKLDFLSMREFEGFEETRKINTAEEGQADG